MGAFRRYDRELPSSDGESGTTQSTNVGQSGTTAYSGYPTTRSDVVPAVRTQPLPAVRSDGDEDEITGQTTQFSSSFRSHGAQLSVEGLLRVAEERLARAITLGRDRVCSE